MSEKEDEFIKITGKWTLDPREVRQIATRMGIPSETPLPRVLINKKFKNPQLHVGKSETDPSTWFIAFPEEDVAQINDDETYVLGSKARGKVGHELAHFIEHLEKGTHPGKSASLETQVEREIDAEIRGKGRVSMSSYLASLVIGIMKDYDLTETGV